MPNRIQRALLSVSNKTGIVELARFLSGMGVEILSTGGTQKALDLADIPVRSVSDYTGFPEMMDGRVKTLHPKIHAGLLAIRDNLEHMQQVDRHGIELIDMVVVNLYPFRETISKGGIKLEDAVEQIDIGGPTMLRAAAKNYKDVVVIVNPTRYPQIIEDMKRGDGCISENLKFELACEVFEHTATYDRAIADYLALQRTGSAEKYPKTLSVTLHKQADLRYGENPHQTAAFYVDPRAKEPSVSTAKVLHGSALSHNNILDLDAAIEMVKDFKEPAAVIIKHTNPCGAGVGEDITEAYSHALLGDPVSAFGSIVGLNRHVDRKMAERIAQPRTFVEAIIAPSFDDGALGVLVNSQWWGENLRVLATGDLAHPRDGMPNMRRVVGGLLLQDFDAATYDKSQFKVVTKRAPTEEEMRDLLFAWVICKHVKSNAIVYAKGLTVFGVGAGQMSRVDSSMIAAHKADGRARGGVVASDAFFPFRDGIDAAARAGIQAAIQPGGSKKDDEVIHAANEHGMAMIFTGMRHFKH
ncbi:MAG: bifunctional phosphoribosylaminoimidazolecarboxamide formyltransferase/IMP cyclohydrolase [Candidatus Lindowbacteria bacterium]|nr:bifunctional phosphoribosylaminoimidazolecarboxamide formyltransferase/IMP cyclohydrolase [Candidatus Lindowbacteria bacterium]